MKTVYKLLLAICVISMTSILSHAERLLTDLSDLKDVKTVYVSNTMIKLATKAGLSSIDGLGDYSALMNDINSIEIVTVDGKKAVKKRRKAIDKFVKKMKNTNTIISQSTENSKNDALKIMEHINAYSGDTDGLIIYVKKETNIALIHLEGTINPDTLSNL